MTIQINPIKFFDTNLRNKDGTYVTKVYRKETKISAHCYPQIPKRYKRKSTKVDLHCAKEVSTNFKEELKFIRNKFLKACFFLPFINSVIKDFIYQEKIVQQNSKRIVNYTFIFLWSWTTVFITEIKSKSKDFIRKFHKFPNNQCRLENWVVWFVWKIKTCTQHTKYTMVNVSVVRITLEKPLEIQQPNT